MRRLLVPLILLLTFLAFGAWSGSAGAIVCPEASDSAFACCGPVMPNPGPSTGCCPSACCGAAAEPACPVAQLTISSSPDPSVAGRRVTISGRLTGGSSGTTVDLWQELPGQSRFQQVAHTTTKSTGDYSFVRGAGVVQMNTSWYTTASGAVSRTVAEHVSAVVHLAASSLHPAVNRAVTFSGRVSPSHGGERIVLQVRTAQGWRTIGSARLGSSSGFSLRHRFGHRGPFVLRALLGGDRRNTQSVSATTRVTVH